MIKRIIFSAAAAILASAAVAFANPYQGIRYAETEGKVYQHLSGQLAIANSTATWSTYTVVMDGNGLVTASSGSFRGSVTAASLTATTINGTSFTGLPITSTAAISASLSTLAAADVIHTSSITALQTSTGAIQTELDAFEAQVAIDTTTLSAGAFLASTQTFTAQNTFTNMVTVSSDVYVGGALDVDVYVTSATASSANEWNISCTAGYTAISCSPIYTAHDNAYGISAWRDVTDAKKCLVSYHGSGNITAAPSAVCAKLK